MRLNEIESKLSSKQIAFLKTIRHEDGNGRTRGKIGDAIEHFLNDSLSLNDLYLLLSTNNYGGPISSYKNAIPKSQIDPNVVEVIKAATSFARKNGRKILKDEKDQFIADTKAALDNISIDEFENIMNKSKYSPSDNTKEWLRKDFVAAKERGYTTDDTLLMYLDDAFYNSEKHLVSRRQKLSLLGQFS